MLPQFAGARQERKRTPRWSVSFTGAEQNALDQQKNPVSLQIGR
jgi:hypothetical protein